MSGRLMLKCPYDPNHVVKATRFGNHLMKCQKKYVEYYLENFSRYPDLMECKYHWLHKMYYPEILYHQEKCASRFDPVPRPPSPPKVEKTDKEIQAEFDAKFCPWVSGTNPEPEAEEQVTDDEDWGTKCDPRRYYFGPMNSS